MTAPDLDRSVEELLAERYAAGRRERGLGPEARVEAALADGSAEDAGQPGVERDAAE